MCPGYNRLSTNHCTNIHIIPCLRLQKSITRAIHISAIEKYYEYQLTFKLEKMT
ncbi:protein of unknown function [Limnospira indica PCC 8005]|uniref:Uncharacterized protein n=1 Tax=Limnospira indica PCC 8005 TaxID=376219 RepID=A0A9P1KFJ3_9CYAN|nr:protein of unknown function [Limnospira indica PCC 8005]